MSEENVIAEVITADSVGLKFGPGWPDDLQGLALEVFTFDLEEVRGADRLGAPLAFNTAPEQLEDVREVIRDLAQEPWADVEDLQGDLRGQLNELLSVLREMVELRSDAAQVTDTRTRLADRLTNIHLWFRRTARPRATRALVRRLLDEALASRGALDDAGELAERVAELRTRVQEVDRQLDARADLARGLRDVARGTAGEELAAVFDARASDRNHDAARWFKALVWSVVGALGGAILTFLAVKPEGSADNPQDFAALGLGVFILGLLAFGVRVCAQNYRVNRHLETVARSKAAALSTFQRLASSVEEEEIRSAVTLTLAQAVFTTEETGFVDPSGDHVTLVERAILPAISGRSGSAPSA